MRLFRRKSPPRADHAVTTHLPLSGDEFGTEDEREAVYALEDRLRTAAAAAGGEHDGNELGGGEAVLYTYGPDADPVFATVRQSLCDFPVREGAYAIKRYGSADDPGALSERVPLP